MRKRAATKMTMIMAKEGLNWLKFGSVKSLVWFRAWAWAFVAERRRINGSMRRMNTREWFFIFAVLFVVEEETKSVSKRRERNKGGF